MNSKKEEYINYLKREAFVNKIISTHKKWLKEDADYMAQFNKKPNPKIRKEFITALYNAYGMEVTKNDN